MTDDTLTTDESSETDMQTLDERIAAAVAAVKCDIRREIEE